MGEEDGMRKINSTFAGRPPGASGDASSATAEATKRRGEGDQGTTMPGRSRRPRDKDQGRAGRGCLRPQHLRVRIRQSRARMSRSGTNHAPRM